MGWETGIVLLQQGLIIQVTGRLTSHSKSKSGIVPAPRNDIEAHMAEKSLSQIRHEEIMNKFHILDDALASRKSLDEKIVSNWEFINGNGKPGAKTQLALIVSSQKRIGAINSALVIALIINMLKGVLF